MSHEVLIALGRDVEFMKQQVATRFCNFAGASDVSEALVAA